MAEAKESDTSEAEKSFHEEATLKLGRDGIVLSPQPSDDPADPLNWSLTKKVLTLFIVALTAGMGAAQALALNSGYFIQAELYEKTAVQLSYGASSAIVGLAVGPLFWPPLAQRIGRPSCIFWSMILTIICCIWSATRTHRDDYNSFVVSRFFASFFGSAGAAIGAGTLIDIFYLHQRGRAFIFYVSTTNLGVVLAPTVSGYIVTSHPWPVQLWWVVGVQGLIALLTLLFFEETAYPRNPGEVLRQRPNSWLAERRATFLPGTQVTLQTTHPKMSPWTSAVIGVCPITILAGILLTMDYGLAVAVTDLLAVFLQSPIEAAGYAFTPAENANFQFCQWIGILVSMAYGYWLNDRLPLWVCQRRGGTWKLEYRIYPALLPAILLMPVSLGLFGACLQYHLHYLLLAFACGLNTMAVDNLSTIVFNYVVECFTAYAMETIAILNFYRLILGVVVPFFVEDWEARVGVGWMFGMMAFFTLLCSSVLLAFIWRGTQIRSWSFARFRKTEDGIALNAAARND